MVDYSNTTPVANKKIDEMKISNLLPSYLQTATNKKFIDTAVETLFSSDKTDSVSGYIVHDVLVPAIKSTLSDMVQGGIEMLLFGERSHT
jgi:hypothetical protein